MSHNAGEPASESESGVLEIATQAEVDAGTDDTKAVTPLKLANAPAASAALPRGHVRGAKLSYVSATTVSLGTSGETSEVRDSSNTDDLTWSGALNAVITSSGAGGLDTGSEASSTWYAVHVIGGNGQTEAAMLSTSSTAPTLPGSYTKFRHIGWVYNNTSSDIPLFTEHGLSTTREVYLGIPAANSQALVNGSATTFTSISLTVGIPPGCGLVYILATHTGGTNGDAAAFRPGNSSETSPIHKVWGRGTVGTQQRSGQAFWIPTDPSDRTIDYANSSASEQTNVWVVAYRIEI